VAIPQHISEVANRQGWPAQVEYKAQRRLHWLAIVSAAEREKKRGVGYA
jgi:hypothetical protein